jgi:uncharacterized protein
MTKTISFAEYHGWYLMQHNRCFARFQFFWPYWHLFGGTMVFSRRTILKSFCTGWALAVAKPSSWQSQELKAVGRLRIWDAHSHLHLVPGNTPEERAERLIQFADRVGVERLMLSQGYSEEFHPTKEQVRKENDRVLKAVRRFPDRVFGSVYLSPAFPDFSLQEFDRCVRDGPMISIGEVEADKRCNVPEMDPIAERAAAMQVPILQHTWIKAGGNEPGESSPYDLVELARRHPRVQFICAHSGGDWERGIRIIRGTKNVSGDIAGFNPTSGVVEMAVRELGAERVIYGSDVGGRSFASQLAKVLGAEIPDSAKELILGGNLRRLLTPILQAKGYRVWLREALSHEITLGASLAEVIENSVQTEFRRNWRPEGDASDLWPERPE